ncbi:MAG: S8 family serine peptidase, partial [Clostridiales bacterium]|nr:S8 family serine peptidase [Clostridiales bacterium]
MKMIKKNGKLRMLVCITMILSILFSNIAPAAAMALEMQNSQAVWQEVLNADLSEYQGTTPALRATPPEEVTTPALRATPPEEVTTPALRATPPEEGNNPLEQTLTLASAIEVPAFPYGEDNSALNTQHATLGLQSSPPADRFIIKYKESATAELAEAAERALERAKPVKSVERLQISHRADRARGGDARGKSGGNAKPSSPEGEQAQSARGLVSILSTTGTITVEELQQQLDSIALQEIAYIQPDYEMTFCTANAIPFDRMLNLQNRERAPQVDSDQRSGDSDQWSGDSDQWSVDSDQWSVDSDQWSVGNSTLNTQHSALATTVALLDTGVDTNHPNLAGKLLNGYDFVNDVVNVNNPEWYYDQGHGTSLAGVIAGGGAKVMPLKVFEGGKAYTSDILAAIAYAEENGAQIANLSFGSRFYNPALEEAIAGSDMLFVCAAGNMLVNTDKYPVYPASFDLPNVLSVASVDEGDKLARFSNYGVSGVDISAPGVDISVPFLDNAMVETSGTSVSAALVSAAAAQVLEAHSDLDAAGLKQRLVDCADAVTGLMDKVAGGKRLNVAYAVSSQSGPNTAVIDVPDLEPISDVMLDEAIEEEYEEFGADGLITYRTPMPTAREGLGVVAVGKKIYAIGGQFNSTYYNKVEIYDTTTDTWTTGANMTYGVSDFSCVAVGTDIYCIGGFNGGYRNYVQVYNTVNNTWSIKTALPQTLMGTAAVEYEGSIYVTGGYNGSFRNYVYQYNVVANTWTSRAGLQSARAYHNAFIYDGKIYIEGGANSTTGSYVNTEEVYNLSTYVASSNGVSRVCGINAALIQKDNRLIIIGGSRYLSNSYSNQIAQRNMLSGNNHYVRINVMATARASLGAAMVDGVVYMIGGKNDDSRYIFNTVEAMEAGYASLETMPQKLKDFTAVELAGNIYISGGIKSDNTSSREMYAYNIIGKKWQQKASLPSGTTLNLIAAAHGKLYLFDRNSNNANRVFEYDPQTDRWTDIASSKKIFSMVQSLNGKIYCITSGSKDVDVFDPLTKEWDKVKDRPNTVGFYDNSNFVVLSGKLYLYASDNMLYCYDPDNDSWFSNNIGSYGAMLSPVYQDLYLFDSSNNNNELRYIYRYSLNEEIVTNYSSYLHEYDYFYQLCTVNNKVYIFAGQDPSNGAEAIVEYMPSVSPWLQKQSPDFYNAYMANAVIEDNIYLTGGYGSVDIDSPRLYMKELYEYNTTNNIWTQKAVTGFTARSKVAGVAVGGKIYAIGGETASNGTSTNKVEEYAPGATSWVAKANLPSYYAHSVAAAAYDGKIYIFGGKGGSTGTATSVLNYVREYNPSNNTWENKTNMPTARYGASAVEINGKIYVAGGFNSSGAAVKTMEVYDPVADTWDTTKKADMPEGKGYCGIVAHDGIYMIGGYDGYTSVNSVYQYDLNADSWYHWPGLDDAIEGVAAAALNGGIYVINGRNCNGNQNNDVSTYNAANYYSPTSSISSYAELTHLGSDIINPSGNLSRHYSDLSFDAPGFTVNVSRTYNSIDTRDSIISKGWVFGFSSKLETAGNDTVIRMPDGSARTFKTESNGTYRAKDSRAALTKSGTEHILTTPDHYQYHYNDKGFMYRMTDPNGNQINLTVNASGQVTRVADAVGRTPTIAYDSNRIST